MSFAYFHGRRVVYSFHCAIGQKSILVPRESLLGLPSSEESADYVLQVCAIRTLSRIAKIAHIGPLVRKAWCDVIPWKGAPARIEFYDLPKIEFESAPPIAFELGQGFLPLDAASRFYKEWLTRLRPLAA